MNKGVAVVALLALTVAGCGGRTTHKAAAPGSLANPWWLYAPPVEFGYIHSITPLGQGFKLRFDLHLLFGVDKTGFDACVDNGDCRHRPTNFLDDTYDHDLKFVVTYYVSPDTPVLLASSAAKAPTVTARYLYGIAHGKNPRHVSLMVEPRYILNAFGFYLEVNKTKRNDGFESVTRLGQVFHP
jgi:hypothetical protein